MPVHGEFNDSISVKCSPTRDKSSALVEVEFLIKLFIFWWIFDLHLSILFCSIQRLEQGMIFLEFDTVFTQELVNVLSINLEGGW